MATKEPKKNLIDDPFINSLRGVDNFVLTDIATDTLNGIITYAARERTREKEKPHPNLQYMDDMKKLRDEVAGLAHNSKIFATRESMTAIIQKYSAMLRELKEKQRL